MISTNLDVRQVDSKLIFQYLIPSKYNIYQYIDL